MHKSTLWTRVTVIIYTEMSVKTIACVGPLLLKNGIPLFSESGSLGGEPLVNLIQT